MMTRGLVLLRALLIQSYSKLLKDDLARHFLAPCVQEKTLSQTDCTMLDNSRKDSERAQKIAKFTFH